MRKIRELDALLAANPSLQRRVREVHPELSFWAWDGRRALLYRKKAKEGKAERRGLIEDRYGKQVVIEVRSRYPVAEVDHDDIHDAFAALWTAERILAGTAFVVPDTPQVDAPGLRMEIWY
jgi:predicted RNase H-like nuclease